MLQVYNLSKILLLNFFQLWSWDRLHVGQPDFGRSLTPSIAQHLDHDANDLPVEGPIGVHHGLLDEDQRLQDKALLDERLPTDPLGCRWRVPLSWAQNQSRVLTFD